MKFFSFLIVSLVMLCTVGAAMASPAVFNSETGITILSIQPYTPGFFNAPFVIATTQAVYTPGQVVTVTFGSDVPYATRSVTFRVGSTTSIDVSSLFSPGTTSYIKTTFTAPNNPGTYKMYLDFKDAFGNILYTDSGIFTVASPTLPVTCPSSYCSGWLNSVRITNGWQQSQSCYTITQNSACTTVSAQTSRFTCDTGFYLQGSACVPNTTPTLCGNGKLESGETCDMGGANGVCPAACNNMCQSSNCAVIPGYAVPPTTPNGAISPYGPGFTGNGTNNTVTTPAPVLVSTGDYTLYAVVLAIGGLGAYLAFKK